MPPPFEFFVDGNETTLVDPDSEQILGAAILSADAGELMSMIEIAMMGKLSYRALEDASSRIPRSPSL